MDTVILKGEISLTNQEKLAKDYMNQEAKKKPLSTASVQKGLDVVVETEEKTLHPNVQRKSALESLVKKTTTSPSKTTSTTTTSAPVIASSVVVDAPKKTATVNITSPAKTTTTTTTPSDDPYAQLEKLGSLRDKGIITQEEFDQKKKQILNL